MYIWRDFKITTRDEKRQELFKSNLTNLTKTEPKHDKKVPCSNVHILVYIVCDTLVKFFMMI